MASLTFELSDLADIGVVVEGDVKSSGSVFNDIFFNTSLFCSSNIFFVSSFNIAGR